MKDKSKKEPVTSASSSGNANFPSSIADKLSPTEALPNFEAMKTEKRPEGATEVAVFILSPEEVARYCPNRGEVIAPLTEKSLNELFAPLPTVGMLSIRAEELHDKDQRIAELEQQVKDLGGQP